MRILLTIVCVLLFAILASCDVRSEIAKKNMEKYVSTPTPPISPTPTPEPIDPADIIAVDIKLEGDTISINGHNQNKTVSCTKFNRVSVNGDTNVGTIRGACRQIMINGDRNEITVDAAMEFVINGTENTVKYSSYANGKRPTVIENRAGNVIEKVSAEAMTSSRSQHRIVK